MEEEDLTMCHDVLRLKRHGLRGLNSKLGKEQPFAGP